MLVASDEIHNRISELLMPRTALTPMHVLQWIMQNTMLATSTNLFHWAQNGLDFKRDADAGHAVAMRELLDLQEMYAAAAGEPE